ncbi:MAG: YicC/YloC family endoribonuclease [Finegoldia magna]|uniref:YicC/YloC family endoribonuclease n=1 Tax=Finegoldia magna TaxID=1260 RepID=UPI000B91B618|nr:YicC/YloC family endoribonuclease [Finegoldia magna]MDU1010275.1 YicC/YloC family endoribonuclease [Finegoldia magna]MDU1087425.1 YicC/YloC family endoribonuclease [Finegoldia magna]MDU7890322.1 YicC/YloC family endoribonuclease [Finegoldia magna]MDU7925593.1 YicC/YloC family endoribonuclease [Finegoldia magna]OXZ39093.1 YicC family protein [Finegoldia magna]
MKSMTGFGSSSLELEDCSIDIEIKSVNNRYLDFNFSMPSYLNFMLEDMKSLIKNKLKRGRVDVYIKIKKYQLSVDSVDINYELAQKIKEKLDSLNQKLDMASDINVRDLVKYDDVMSFTYKDLDNEFLHDNILKVLDEAVNKIYSMRSIEGDNLMEDLSTNLSKIEEQISKISSLTENSVKEYRENLFNKISELLDEEKIDKDRMYLEVALMADKVDINEELKRFDSHIVQFKSAMDMKDCIGRKLDFIIQEMNREINTISSKSNDESISVCVIEVKSLIEKLREQVQNIE